MSTSPSRKRNTKKTSSRLEERIVLLLDDSKHVLKILSRHLERRVDRIYSATNPDQAEKILKKNRITTLVCDHGTTSPSGSELITKWRKRYNSISRALVLTGADVGGISASPEVDKILSKASALSEILAEIGR